MSNKRKPDLIKPKQHYCDCGKPATHKLTARDYECDRCRTLRKRSYAN